MPLSDQTLPVPRLLPILWLLATSSLLAQSQTADSPSAASRLPGNRQRGAAAVDVTMCREWLYKLASPEFEGRSTGEPGFQKAADYVAAHFKALGLEARGDDGSYFQNLPWTTTSVDAAKTYLSFEKAGAEVLRIANERLTGSASANLSTKGEAVLLVITAKAPAAPADGASAPARNRTMPKIDGLDELDLKDKVVLVHVRAAADDQDAVPMTQFAARRGLQGKAAAAVLFVGAKESTGGLRGRGGMGRRGGNPAAAGRNRSPLDATFGGKDFEALLTACGIDANTLGEAPLLTNLPLTASIEVAVAEAKAPAMNVWAVLPGSDPKLRDEYVVIGSHLDHLGLRGDTYCPGADDDGSGTTGVMAVSRMLAKNDARPARSVLFVCFSGEEMGLLGSEHFSKNCPIPLASIVAELQMDMIGRDEEEGMDGPRRVNIGETAEQNRNSLHLVGTQKLSPALHELCLETNQRAGFDLEYDQESLFSRSDHANFAEKGVPIAFFFTGLHKDYHQVTDTPDKIHYEKLLRVATYVYDLAFELATATGRPEIDEDLWQKYRASTRGAAPKVPAAPLLKR